MEHFTNKPWGIFQNESKKRLVLGSYNAALPVFHDCDVGFVNINGKWGYVKWLACVQIYICSIYIYMWHWEFRICCRTLGETKSTEHIFILLKGRIWWMKKMRKNTIVIKVKCSLCRILYTIWYVDPFRDIHSFKFYTLSSYNVLGCIADLLGIVCK